MTHVFISYSSKDHDFVVKLAEDLKRDCVYHHYGEMPPKIEGALSASQIQRSKYG